MLLLSVEDVDEVVAVVEVLIEEVLLDVVLEDVVETVGEYVKVAVLKIVGGAAPHVALTV